MASSHVLGDLKGRPGLSSQAVPVQCSQCWAWGGTSSSPVPTLWPALGDVNTCALPAAARQPAAFPGDGLHRVSLVSGSRGASGAEAASEAARGGS